MATRFQTLPGFRDFYPEDCAVRNYLFRLWRQTAARFGFAEWDAPVLEPLELFTEKSGEEIRRQLFEFTDKGGRAVSLRPEMTPSLARMAGAKAASLRKPVKWFCIGENYRYERMQKGRGRSFYQFNADILGEAGFGADAEIIALAVENLRAFGLGAQDAVVRLSDRTLWVEFLRARVAEAVVPAVLAIIDKLERESEAEILKKLSELGADAAKLLAEIRAFLKLDSVEALRNFCAGFEGAARDKLAARIGDWEKLLGRLNALGVGDWVRVDLGIVRGLAYYTGFVFEIFERTGDARALAGGGRYDHLVGKLGGAEMPAVGFGMGDMTVRLALESRGLLPEFFNAPDFYVVAGEAELPVALADVSALRQAGVRVEYTLKETGFGKQFKQADAARAPYALIYGAEEVAANAVKVKDFSNGKEALLPREGIVERLLAVRAYGLPKEPCHGHHD